MNYWGLKPILWVHKHRTMFCSGSLQIEQNSHNTNNKNTTNEYITTHQPINLTTESQQKYCLGTVSNKLLSGVYNRFYVYTNLALGPAVVQNNQVIRTARRPSYQCTKTANIRDVHCINQDSTLADETRRISTARPTLKRWSKRNPTVGPKTQYQSPTT